MSVLRRRPEAVAGGTVGGDCWPAPVRPPGSLGCVYSLRNLVSGHISPNLERQGRIALTLSLFRRASLVNRITANRRLGAASFRRVLRWRVLLRSPRAWTATRPRPEGPAHAFLPGQCRKGTPALPISVELKRCALISSLIRRASGFRGGKR